MSEYIPAQLRRLVLVRAANICEYCRAQAMYSSDPITVDHIIAQSLGGITTENNLACSCFGCNQHKAIRVIREASGIEDDETNCNQHKAIRVMALDPTTGLRVPLFHPRQQRWEEHFAWNEDFTQMLGITPTGRATIEALQLNRFGLVNLRRALHAIGEHPPK